MELNGVSGQLRDSNEVLARVIGKLGVAFSEMAIAMAHTNTALLQATLPTKADDEEKQPGDGEEPDEDLTSYGNSMRRIANSLHELNEHGASERWVLEAIARTTEEYLGIDKYVLLEPLKAEKRATANADELMSVLTDLYGFLQQNGTRDPTCSAVRNKLSSAYAQHTGRVLDADISRLGDVQADETDEADEKENA